MVADSEEPEDPAQQHQLRSDDKKAAVDNETGRVMLAVTVLDRLRDTCS